MSIEEQLAENTNALRGVTHELWKLQEAFASAIALLSGTPGQLHAPETSFTAQTGAPASFGPGAPAPSPAPAPAPAPAASRKRRTKAEIAADEAAKAGHTPPLPGGGTPTAAPGQAGNALIGSGQAWPFPGTNVGQVQQQPTDGAFGPGDFAKTGQQAQDALAYTGPAPQTTYEQLRQMYTQVATHAGMPVLNYLLAHHKLENVAAAHPSQYDTMAAHANDVMQNPKRWAEWVAGGCQ